MGKHHERVSSRKKSSLTKYAKSIGICYFCGCKDKELLTADHFVPISKGGTNDRSNVICACYACNQAKDDMTAEQFIALILRRGCLPYGDEALRRQERWRLHRRKEMESRKGPP